jgi:2-hydroxychromene-2-carboxylate isomerase
MISQAKTKRRITLHYDLISPFAHIALRRLSELPDDVEVTPSPVLLGALLRHWGQLGPGEIAPKRRFTYRLSTHLATRHGIPIRYPPRHPFNPLAALRILAGADADLTMVGRAFDFVFGQGRPVDTEEGLADFARTVGAPVERASDERAKARLRALTEEAAARGVFGVPTFDVETAAGRELFWGVDSLDMLNDWLADPALFEREPYAHLEGVEIGVVRK